MIFFTHKIEKHGNIQVAYSNIYKGYFDAERT